jgi:hypothetical protein
MRTVGTEIFWPWYTLIGCLITLGVAGLVQLFQSDRLPTATDREEQKTAVSQ